MYFHLIINKLILKKEEIKMKKQGNERAEVHASNPRQGNTAEAQIMQISLDLRHQIAPSMNNGPQDDSSSSSDVISEHFQQPHILDSLEIYFPQKNS